MQCSLLNYFRIRELSFFIGKGGPLFVGGPEFFGVVKGGTIFFSGPKMGGRIFSKSKRGGKNFSPKAKGGPEEIGDRPSQTDGPPPAKKR